MLKVIEEVRYAKHLAPSVRLVAFDVVVWPALCRLCTCFLGLAFEVHFILDYHRSDA